MKQLLIIVCIVLWSLTHVRGQSTGIKNIKWEIDHKLHLEMTNDSNYIFDINSLFHSGTVKKSNYSQFTYYPVALGESFLKQLQEKNINYDSTIAEKNVDPALQEHKTLWSAIHGSIGGGYIHFINCITYALESGNLKLTAPLLERPESKWKPKPKTDSYIRTKKWDYYLPITQKEAHKEYEILKKENKLGDLKNIPANYIDLFLRINDKEYESLKTNKKTSDLAKIDLVKIILGSRYLGYPQIDYIKSMVLKSVLKYTIIQDVPSVIIFDDYNAAVAMRLDEFGYAIEKIVFYEQNEMNQNELALKEQKIYNVVAGINEVNKRLFKEKLGKHYQ